VKTVLVVDDEPGITEALNELLSEEGFHVLTALNGKQALERIAEKRPELILLDYMMPGMDGSELLTALRRDSAYQDIPVLMMSFIPRSSIPLACTPTAFLRKPFRIEQLLAEVDRLLREDER
jgi:DNA-binding response OmpR family regulator